MQITLYQNDYISRYVTDIDVPDDATTDQIEAAVEAAIASDGGARGLCHQCTRDVGEMTGANEYYAENGETGAVYWDDSTLTHVRAELSKAQVRIAELEAQLTALSPAPGAPA